MPYRSLTCRPSSKELASRPADACTGMSWYTTALGLDSPYATLPATSLWSLMRPAFSQPGTPDLLCRPAGWVLASTAEGSRICTLDPRPCLRYPLTPMLCHARGSNPAEHLSANQAAVGLQAPLYVWPGVRSCSSKALGMRLSDMSRGWGNIDSCGKAPPQCADCGFAVISCSSCSAIYGYASISYAKQVGTD